MRAENIARALLRRTVWALTMPGRWLVEATGPKAEAFGIRLVASRCDDAGRDAIFYAKTTLALELIAEHDPRWLARLQRDLRSIWMGGPGPSSYSGRTCTLSWNSVARDSPLELALVIIHEGVHARMDASGVANGSAERAEREERAAVRQQIAFASRFPDSEKTVHDLEATLARRWWTRTARQEYIQRLATAGEIPGWAARIAQFTNRLITPREQNER
jgi:hypothetical protein